MIKAQEYSLSSADGGVTINSSGEKLASVDKLTQGLRDRLAENPNDLDGWVLLAKSYHHLQRWDDYHEAIKKAESLGYKVEAPPALKQNAHAAHSALTSGKLSNSVVEEISATIQDTNASRQPAGIRLKVSIDPATLKTVSAETSVFLFARSAEGKGPPLAVDRKRVRDFPAEIVLDDSMAMVSGMNISSAKSIIVGARISLSGNPMKSEGDIERLSGVISTSREEAVELLLGGN